MRLYTCNTLPNAWIAEDEDGKLMIFDSRADGWTDRTRYRGHKRALTEVLAYHAIGTGWPGVGVGRPARTPDGESRDHVLKIRVSPAEKARIEDLAREAGMDVSTYIRSKTL